jgi:hypothetical protein
MIDSGLLANESLLFATRMLLSTNSEPMLKLVLWCLWILTRSFERKLFTRAYMAENLLDLIRPIAEKKVKEKTFSLLYLSLQYSLDYISPEFEDGSLTEDIELPEKFEGVEGIC